MIKRFCTFFVFWVIWVPFAHAYSNNAAELEQKLLFICQQYKQKIALTKNNQPQLLEFSKKKPSLEYLTDLFKYGLSSDQTDVFFKHLEAQQCIQAIRIFSMSLEEQVENESIRQIYKYYQVHPHITKLPLNSTSEKKFLKLQEIMDAPEKLKFPFLEDYFHLVAGPLRDLNNTSQRNIFNLNNTLKANAPNLKNQHVTFVGAGFPLSGVMVHLLTNANINLIDIDENALKQARRFLVILDKAGVIDLKHFTLRLADGKNLLYGQKVISKKHIKTDILYLAAALPTQVKRDIFQKIHQDNNKDLVIIDRYVSGIYKLLYEGKVPSSELTAFKTLSKIYPRNLYSQKLKVNSSNIPITQYNNKFVSCSTRILKLK